MIGFVIAMEKECNAFLNKLKTTKEYDFAGKKFVKSELGSSEIIVGIAGIGKVNSAMTTQLMIDKFAPELIINFGFAGGKEGSGLKAGDIVLLDKVCQYDFDLSEVDDVNIGYMQDYDTTYYNTDYSLYNGNAFKIRTGATGDRFTSQKYFLDIIRQLNAQVVDMEACAIAQVVDMEACAIAQVCQANDIPVISIKLISDVDGMDVNIFEQYKGNSNAINDKFVLAITDLMDNIINN